MKILVVGGGGREHALAWKCAASTRVTEVLVAPGNAGTALEYGVRNVAVAAEDGDRLLSLALDEAVDLTIVGPEVPLVAGLVDRFEAAGLACFGPRAEAARLEGSKAFTKDFLERHAIPTAAWETFTEFEPALDYIRSQGVPIVVKADGLAAGKGVVVAHTVEDAEAAARDMLNEEVFGAAGSRIVVEEFLRGEEASFIVITDGSHILPLATSQDHKARDDGDTGPNTGGMGAYSPAPVVTPAVEQRILEEIIGPTVEGLAADGIRYRGFLYAGLMIDPSGAPKVLEFNCRFGDPETQPIMARLESDLVDLCEATLTGGLSHAEVRWDPRAALGVVLAAGGYPERYETGAVIDGLEAAAALEDVKVFHAGTRLEGSQVLTAGGRVLCVVGLGGTVTDARVAAYRGVERIHWPAMYCRRDIGHLAVAREASPR